MIKKIKNLIKENRAFNKAMLKNSNEIVRQSREIEWAHIFHDSINGKVWLKNTSLNIGRWAGNYSFFYLLHRVLNDFKPESVLEFGLGESSKMVAAYINNELKNTTHLVIEQDEKWLNAFNLKNTLSINTKVKVCALEKRMINEFEVNCYQNLNDIVKKKFDLYIIDGPFGSPRFSRYDVVLLAESFLKNDEFIIIIDDYQRKGEKDTVQELEAIFLEKQIEIFKAVYLGNKEVCVLATNKYRYVKSL